MAEAAARLSRLRRRDGVRVCTRSSAVASYLTSATTSRRNQPEVGKPAARALPTRSPFSCVKKADGRPDVHSGPERIACHDSASDHRHCQKLMRCSSSERMQQPRGPSSSNVRSQLAVAEDIGCVAIHESSSSALPSGGSAHPGSHVNVLAPCAAHARPHAPASWRSTVTSLHAASRRMHRHRMAGPKMPKLRGMLGACGDPKGT